MTHTHESSLKGRSGPRSTSPISTLPHDDDSPPRYWERLFAIFLALIPVLELYASPVSGVPLSKFPLAFFLLVAVVMRLTEGRPRFVAGASAPLILVAGLAFGTILASFVTDDLDSEAIVRRFALLLLWALVTLYCVPTLVNLNGLVRAVELVAVLATAYLFLQYGSVAMFGARLPNVLEFGPLRVGNLGYVDAEALQAYYQLFYYRPASFFAEPQYYSDYATLALVVVLFRHRESRFRTLATALFLTVGLLVSTSTTAVVMAFSVWAFWLLGPFARNTTRAELALRTIAGVLAPIAAVLVLSRPIMQQILFEKLYNLEDSARLGRSFDLYFSLDEMGRIFGVGIGNEGTLFRGDSTMYYNSVTAVLLGCGMLGAIMLLAYWWGLIRLPGTIPRILTIVYIILSVTGSMLYADRSLLYLSIILMVSHNSREPARSYARRAGKEICGECLICLPRPITS